MKSIMNQERKNKTINLGIELFRMILSFLIVVYHIHSRKIESLLLHFSLKYLGYYTSSFFLISFYFSHRVFASKNVETVKQRLKRIILPYIIWPILIFIENNIYYYIKYHHMKYSLKNLVSQLLLGSNNFNISVIIIIFTFICPEKLTLHFLILLAVFAYSFNVKEINSKIFSHYNIIISHSIGRLPGCYIFSINGYLLGSFDLLRKLNQAKKLKILLLFPFFFHYLREIQGINKFFIKLSFLIHNIILVILFIFFASLPTNSIFNLKFISLIKQITGFTGGIYYLHLFISI